MAGGFQDRPAPNWGEAEGLWKQNRSKGTKEVGGAKWVPDDDYLVRVKHAELRKSRTSEAQYVIIMLTVKRSLTRQGNAALEQRGRAIDAMIFLSGEEDWHFDRLRQFAFATDYDESAEGASLKDLLNDSKDKQLIVRTTTKEAEGDYQKSSRVNSYRPVEEDEKAKVADAESQVTDDDDDDDDIPF